MQSFTYSGSGVVPVILAKNNNQYVETVFELQASLGSCSGLMTELGKKDQAANGSEFHAYYCVAVDSGQIGTPTLVTKFAG